MELGFGTGILYATPLTDANGNTLTNTTPVQFAQLQDISGDISFDSKTLYGASQFPIAFGRGKGKFELKAKTANFNSGMFSTLFLGQPRTPGIRAVSVNQAFTVPATTAYTVTVTPPSSGTFVTDLGVIYQSSSLPLTKVAAVTATGQYSVSAAGVYTFFSGDASAAVYISYEYTATSTTGPQVTIISNLLMGYAPSFAAQLNMSYQGKNLAIRLNNCVASKWNFPFKNDDFVIPEFDFMALADASGTIGIVSTAE